mgnify:CR=1 FL=1
MSIPLNMNAVFKHYPGKYALNGLDFAASPGQVVGLLGRNGAGKSTLLQAALGLCDIDSGSITVFGEHSNNLSECVKARIGYVPQQVDLFGWMTAAQMLGFFKAFYPGPRWNEAKVASLLERWSIPTNLRIAKMSGGEKQRLAIIRALAHDPELLILDEPVSSLDVAGRRDFLRELVDTVIERETTIIFSTHILSDLERVASQVAFMKEGKIILRQTLDSIAEYSRRLVGTVEVFGANPIAGEISRVVDRQGRMSVLVAFGERDFALLNAWRARGVHDEAVSLEDLFIEVTK